MNVVAKKEALRSDRREIARHAVVLRRQTRCREQRGLDAAELGLAICIQQIQPPLQLGAVLVQALTNDFVSAGFELRGRLG